jgi:hypothetical protein
MLETHPKNINITNNISEKILIMYIYNKITHSKSLKNQIYNIIKYKNKIK